MLRRRVAGSNSVKSSDTGLIYLKNLPQCFFRAKYHKLHSFSNFRSYWNIFPSSPCLHRNGASEPLLNHHCLTHLQCVEELLASMFTVCPNRSGSYPVCMPIYKPEFLKLRFKFVMPLASLLLSLSYSRTSLFKSLARSLAWLQNAWAIHSPSPCVSIRFSSTSLNIYNDGFERYTPDYFYWSSS